MLPGFSVFPMISNRIKNFGEMMELCSVHGKSQIVIVIIR